MDTDTNTNPNSAQTWMQYNDTYSWTAGDIEGRPSFLRSLKSESAGVPWKAWKACVPCPTVTKWCKTERFQRTPAKLKEGKRNTNTGCFLTPSPPTPKSSNCQITWQIPSKKCQNLLTGWHLEFLGGGQLKKPPCINMIVFCTQSLGLLTPTHPQFRSKS